MLIIAVSCSVFELPIGRIYRWRIGERPMILQETAISDFHKPNLEHKTATRNLASITGLRKWPL